MEKRKSLIKETVLYGIGAALFLVIGCTLPIPIPNTTAHIDLGYVVMGVYAFFYGPIAGAVVGGLGRFLEDIVLFGSIGSPGWLIASICMGLLIGLVFKKTRKLSNIKIATTIQIFSILLINAIFLIGLAPFISSMWNGVPYLAKLPSGISAFATNSIAIICVAIPIANTLKRILPKQYINEK